MRGSFTPWYETPMARTANYFLSYYTRHMNLTLDLGIHVPLKFQQTERLSKGHFKNTNSSTLSIEVLALQVWGRILESAFFFCCFEGFSQYPLKNTLRFRTCLKAKSLSNAHCSNMPATSYNVHSLLRKHKLHQITCWFKNAVIYFYGFHIVMYFIVNLGAALMSLISWFKICIWVKKFLRDNSTFQ